jgi:hypothetical protein
MSRTREELESVVALNDQVVYLLAALRAIAERGWAGEEKSWRTEALEMRDLAAAAIAKMGSRP